MNCDHSIRRHFDVVTQLIPRPVLIPSSSVEDGHICYYIDVPAVRATRPDLFSNCIYNTNSNCFLAATA